MWIKVSVVVCFTLKAQMGLNEKDVDTKYGVALKVDNIKSSISKTYKVNGMYLNVLLLKDKVISVSYKKVGGLSEQEVQDIINANKVSNIKTHKKSDEITILDISGMKEFEKSMSSKN